MFESHLKFFITALLASLLSSALTRDHGCLWHLATLSTAFVFLYLGLIAKGKLWQSLYVLLLTTYLALSTTVVFFAFTQANPRLTLLFGNENSLAANLVVLAAACFVVKPVRWLPYASLLGLVALVFLGARLAFACLLVLLLFQLYVAKSKWLNLVVTAFTLVGVFLFWWQPKESGNMLRFSNELSQAVWRRDYVLETKQLAKVPGPLAQAVATRLSYTPDARAPYPGLLLLQTRGVSEEGEGYIASIYLRSDVPVRVRLSNNITHTVCPVTPAWSRCVTPVAEGDGESYALFRLSTDVATPFTLDVWGAQLERGTRATEPQLTQTSLGSRILYRIAISRTTSQPATAGLNLDVRLSIYKTAWQLFLQHPLAGVGWGGVTREFKGIDFGTPAPIGHAHNLLLQQLAETGILGTLAWGLVFWGVLLSLGHRCWYRLWPLVLVVLMLNTLDFTYYTNLAYYGYWLTIGLVAGAKARGTDGQG
jgi:hypothetical protein